MTIPARYIGGKKVHRTTTFIIDVDRYLLQLQIPWISWHLRLLTRPPTVDMRGPGERHRGLPKGGRGTYHEISIDDRDVMVPCGGRDHLDGISVRETEEISD